MSAPTWNRVSRAELCPVCGCADWCLVAADGTAAICPRTESPKRCGDAGWLHRLRDGQGKPGTRRFVIQPHAAAGDFFALAARYQQAAPAGRLENFANSLGLSVETLTALRVGWSAEHVAWSFPMTDPATGRVVGIRLRAPDGSKFSVKGGKEGLFLPTTEPALDAPVLIAEGPTDAAALLDLGFLNVAGRPSCTGGIRHVVTLVRARGAKEVVVVADADDAGRRGAANLASVLRVYVPAVRVVEPPAGMKDVRAWKQAGPTRTDVERLIQAAPVRRLTVTTTFRRNT
jgi:hypothetical protein